MSAPRRPPRRNVDGVLLLDKPSGISSNGALGRVKRLYNPAKAGHTGTLDPLASGLLPICVGAATRFAQFLLDAHKRYTATVRFGITTTTQDADGDIVLSRAVVIDTNVKRVLARVWSGVGGAPPGITTAERALADRIAPAEPALASAPPRSGSLILSRSAAASRYAWSK